MINPEDDVFVDLSTSCSQDVAVMKLLGWSRGPILRRKILLTEDGISEDQMPFIPLNEISLNEQLMEMRAVARKDLIIAAESEEPHEDLEAREKAVQRYDDLIKQAHEFSLDITDALNGEEPSALILDQVRSQAEGEAYITLRSLDRWAKAKYGISIWAASSGSIQTGEPPAAKAADAQPAADRAPDADTASSSGIGDVESLAVTFAFLVEAYAQKHPKEMLRTNNSVIVSAMAEEIVEIIKRATKNTPPRGQGDEMIRKRIKAAVAMKDRKLRSR